MKSGFGQHFHRKLLSFEEKKEKKTEFEEKETCNLRIVLDRHRRDLVPAFHALSIARIPVEKEGTFFPF